MTTGRTGLTKEQFDAAWAKVRLHLLRGCERISNAGLRELTGLNYDQAIKFFNTAVGAGMLERRGRASGIHYVLPVLPGAVDTNDPSHSPTRATKGSR
jgi:hypothetical protein